MELTQADYEARKGRVDAGEGDDEDRRLVKHYEREGYTWPGSSSETSSDSRQQTTGNTEPGRQSPAPTTENPSNPDAEGSSAAGQTGGPGQPTTDGRRGRRTERTTSG